MVKKINNKGFTLIEIIITFGLIAIVGVLLGSSFNNALQTEKELEYEMFVEKVKSAANVLISSNDNFYDELLGTESKRICISIEDLIKNKLLDSDTIDPETNLEITSSEIENSKKNVLYYLNDNELINIEYPALNQCEIFEVSDLYK